MPRFPQPRVRCRLAAAGGSESGSATCSWTCRIYGRYLQRHIVRLTDAFRLPRWRSVIAVTVVALLLGLIGHSAMLQSETHASHQPHALLSSLGGEFAVNVDHAHLVKGSVIACHNVFATAALPRTATTLLALGAVAALAAITAVLANLAVAAGRGPPQRGGPVVAGQDFLTRFCLARR
uniref:Lipoprotein LpqS n=1 Tax=Mycobacterium riyadhense TaxID=486698 RepID=A0A653F5S0_9MYCO|nr:hypothetical protein BIN_B_05495 [Mycobacterium riyadhense]